MVERNVKIEKKIIENKVIKKEKSLYCQLLF